MPNKKIYQVEISKIKRFSLFGVLLILLISFLALSFVDIRPYGFILSLLVALPIGFFLSLWSAAKKGNLNIVISDHSVTGPGNRHYTETNIPFNEIDFSSLKDSLNFFEKIKFFKQVKNVYGDNCINITNIGFDPEQIFLIIQDLKTSINDKRSNINNE